MAKVTITIDDIEGEPTGANINTDFQPPLPTDKGEITSAAQCAALVMLDAISKMATEAPEAE